MLCIYGHLKAFFILTTSQLCLITKEKAKKGKERRKDSIAGFFLVLQEDINVLCYNRKSGVVEKCRLGWFFGKQKLGFYVTTKDRGCLYARKRK